MILPDANLLLYAVDETARHHEPAASWLEELLSGSETVAMSWMVMTAFLRIATNARLYEHPRSVDEAFGIVQGWLDRGSTTIVTPTRRHLQRMSELLATTGVGGNLVNDAHLAALAIEHGATLHSADHDFARFPGLAWHNPLAG